MPPDSYEVKEWVKRQYREWEDATSCLVFPMYITFYILGGWIIIEGAKYIRKLLDENNNS